ncbi:MAG TPA: CpsD/CapB family tyrosine-protein kinase [Alphaproteobacteria bacterium]|nr:CpsD/CapB family tyrosine-protein kinase [Alphaproteobacteria bacterium]
MSRYFKQTQQSQQPANLDPINGGALDNLLGAIKESHEASSAVADNRLEGCRKVTFNPQRLELISQIDKFNWQAAEAYRALRTRLMRTQAASGLRSVVITSAVQGDGKTLTAANLALCFAQLTGFKVLLVDADLRSRGLTRLLGHPSGPGLTDLLAGNARYEQAICSTNVPNLYVLGAGAACASPPELLAGARFKEFIGWAGEGFKLVLIDSPPLLTIADCELITSACDGVLMVVRAARTHRDLLESAATQLDQKKLLGLVYNGAEYMRKQTMYRDYAVTARKQVAAK